MSDDPEERRIGDAAAVTITPYPDGPYLIRGAFVVRDPEGNEMPLQRRTIALCRCGKSRMRPLCDGTHRLTGFEAPGGLERWPDEGAR
jgi:CDGSH-type Zn-finger protein